VSDSAFAFGLPSVREMGEGEGVGDRWWVLAGVKSRDSRGKRPEVVERDQPGEEGGTGYEMAYMDKANRRNSIQTWALEEARRRLETEGVIPDSTKPRKITEVLNTVSGK
jgi:hypothetical protein